MSHAGVQYRHRDLPAIICLTVKAQSTGNSMPFPRIGTLQRPLVGVLPAVEPGSGDALRYASLAAHCANRRGQVQIHILCG